MLTIKAWELNDQSSILSCSGILGSGKSVLTANLIEELVARRKSVDDFICYFFCRYDDCKSLKLRNIVGSITRQLLEQQGFQAKVGFQAPLPDQFDTNKLKKVLIDHAGGLTGSCFIIVDGLDECSTDTAHGIYSVAADLAGSGKKVKTFMSSRFLFRDLKEYGLQTQHKIDMSESHATLREFIDDALEQLLESEELELSDPSLILSIRERFVDGADGMSVTISP